MVRDDLYITVPSFFRCPISLDVMKSPVSLCTGVTYDRASIQRWLDSGNNTCPATMQVLHSKEFVPNRTLQRLIQIWTDSVQVQQQQQQQHQHQRQHQHQGRVDLVTDSVPTEDEIKCIVKEMETPQKETTCRLDALSKIVCFAKESEEKCDFLAKLDGFVPMLLDFLGNVDDHDDDNNKSIDFIEQVVRVLDIILTKIEDHQQLMKLVLKKKNKNNNNNATLSSLLLVIQQGITLHSKIGSVKILESVAIDAESKLLIAEKEGLLSELVKLIGVVNDQILIEASLSCLIAISMPKRVKAKLIQYKVIKEVTKLLTAPNMSVSVTEKSLKLLEMVSSCKEGRTEMSQDRACLEAVLQKMLKVSSKATEHAVMILWSLCYLFKDQTAQEAVTESNGLTKILLLMQSNCSAGVRQMCADLLKIFRVNSKASCLSSYDTKTTHIMPF